MDVVDIPPGAAWANLILAEEETHFRELRRRLVAILATCPKRGVAEGVGAGFIRGELSGSTAFPAIDPV
jgi:hypothetical protein